MIKNCTNLKIFFCSSMFKICVLKKRSITQTERFHVIKINSLILFSLVQKINCLHALNNNNYKIINILFTYQNKCPVFEFILLLLLQIDF